MCLRSSHPNSSSVKCRTFDHLLFLTAPGFSITARSLLCMRTLHSDERLGSRVEELKEVCWVLLRRRSSAGVPSGLRAAYLLFSPSSAPWRESHNCVEKSASASKVCGICIYFIFFNIVLLFVRCQIAVRCLRLEGLVYSKRML